MFVLQLQNGGMAPPVFELKAMCDRDPVSPSDPLISRTHGRAREPSELEPSQSEQRSVRRRVNGRKSIDMGKRSWGTNDSVLMSLAYCILSILML